MNGLTGMEKFSHLEDKIYLTIEFAKKMRDEKERFEKEAIAVKRNADIMKAENKEAADLALDRFQETYAAKYPKAVDKVRRRARIRLTELQQVATESLAGEPRTMSNSLAAQPSSWRT